MTDEQLVQETKNGNTEAQDFLLQKFKPLVKQKSGAYYIIGGDKEDIIQEGMIGLYKAIRDYNPDKQLSFYAFAALCINRQIISAIKASTRQKHRPLNASLSLNQTGDHCNSDVTRWERAVVTYIDNPEALLIDREAKNDFEAHIQTALSAMECHVLSLHLQGQRYSEIAVILQKSEKSIDNALQRVRRKIDKFLQAKKQADRIIDTAP